jgi:hypothetical protein
MEVLLLLQVPAELKAQLQERTNMNFFSSGGMVVRLPSEAKIMSFYLYDEFGPGETFDFSYRMAVATSFDESENAIIELKQMFNNRMYINVFGDQPGFLSITGVFAHATCDSDYGENGKPLYTGWEMLHYYYRQHKASRRPFCVPILLGGLMYPVVYQAFLLGMKLRAPDAQNPLGQFALQFAYPIQGITAYDAFTSLYLQNDQTPPLGDLGDVGDFPNPPDDSFPPTGSPGDSPGLASASTSGLFLP